MRRAERLFRLVHELRARRVVRAADLACAMEVSPRTIYRDIAHLQASGLPIDGEAGIGYVLRPGFDLPAVTFTHDQIAALGTALSFAESLDDPALAAAAREVRAKLQAAMPQPEARALADAPFFSLARRSGGPDHPRTLRAAIRQRRIVRLDYADAEGRPTARDLHPLALWSLPDGAMVSGWCALRGGFRTFRLDRITALILTDQTFPPDPARDLRAFLAAEGCAGGGSRAGFG